MIGELLMEMRDLSVEFPHEAGQLRAVNKVDFDLYTSWTFGVVGESGCGKTMTSSALMGLVPLPGRATGEVLLRRRKGVTLEQPINITSLHIKGPEIRSIRGNDIAMIFQEPMAAFSQIHTVGNQITEPILLHRTKDKKEAWEIAIDMLDRVGISNPRQRMEEYPQQLSGGMQQRVMIAMALSCNPSLLIADEPTTALDVTVQAQVLELIKEIQQKYSMSVLYITHDLGVIAEIADEVAVMYLGSIVEQADVRTVFHNPTHPYTQALMRSIPKMELSGRARLSAIKGSVPTPINLPEACPFDDRCDRAMPGICDAHMPPKTMLSQAHSVRCFLYGERPEAREGADT